MDYKLDEVIDTLQESATEALKDGGTSEWGHRTLQVVEWLKEYRVLKTKTGKWEYKMHYDPYCYECSTCHALHRARYDYCPTCGSDMRGEQV